MEDGRLEDGRLGDDRLEDDHRGADHHPEVEPYIIPSTGQIAERTRLSMTTFSSFFSN
jgi:hypothetical protein